MKRRRFVQLAGLSAAALPFAGISKNIIVAPQTEDNLFELFQTPEGKYKPFVRWWWNGDRVAGQEVLREFDIMKEAGIGGVEINPIRWNGNADAIGIPELPWGSKEWLDVVYAAVNGARDKGITCDMIIGSGWPYGGEFVPRSEQCQVIALGTKDFEGGIKMSVSKKELLDSVNPAFASGYDKPEKELFTLRLAPGEMKEFDKGIDLNSQLQNDTITFDIPAGKHVLYYLVKITGFAAVIQGALGANGPVINHYDKTAVSNYLNGFAEKLTSRLGKLDQYFRAFFTDSIELEGANWCSDMFEEFKKRRGYDLVPYFPFILFKIGEMGNAVNEVYGSTTSTQVKDMLNRIRYDFEITKHELFHERFIHTFTDWCTKHGVKSRMQAYGMDCHPLEASMMIDIPECETWIWVPEVEEFGPKGEGRNYTMVNKFVSSAAHLKGKQLISCEEMTNTGRIFENTLERIKVTGDQSNLSGVTHSVLHGFNYSPLEAPFPGWIRYGSFLNERNTWWPYFRLWSDYKARLSCVFQNSIMQAGIAVLHPLADLASAHGFQRDPFPRVTYPSYVHMVWEAIHQNGHGCDYTSEHILQQSTYSKGNLIYNSRSYHTLVLIEVETIEPATAKALKKFADAGGKIVFIAKTPHVSSGFIKSVEQGKQITDISKEILAAHKNTTGIVPAPGADMIAWFADIQEKFSIKPYIKISKPVYHSNMLYYKHEAKDIFYFANYSAQHTHNFAATFETTKTPWLWDAETGKKTKFPQDKNGALQITLNPAETKLIVFDDDKTQGEIYTEINAANMQAKALTSAWQVELHHVNGTTHKTTLKQLQDLKQIPAYKDFAGTITYHTVANISIIKDGVYLDLGKLNDVTEVEVNGQPAGTKWYGNHLYNIGKNVRQGDNYITIKLTTILGHYTRALVNNKAAQEWSTEDVPSPIGLVNPVRILTGS